MQTIQAQLALTEQLSQTKAATFFYELLSHLTTYSAYLQCSLAVRLDSTSDEEKENTT